MQEKVLSGKSRLKGKKSSLKNLRKSHFIPGVCYGKNSFLFEVNKNDFYSMFKITKHHIPFTFIINENDKFTCLVKDYSIDSLSKEVIHVDFLSIDPTSTNLITLEIPILVKGIPIGAKQGGIIEQKLYSLKIKTPSSNIPENILLDISSLNVRDSIYVHSLKSDSKLDSIKILNPESQLVVTLSPSRVTRLAEAKEQKEEKKAKDKKK